MRRSKRLSLFFSLLNLILLVNCVSWASNTSEVIVAGVAAGPSSAAANLPSSQIQALHAFYNATSGDTWTWLRSARRNANHTVPGTNITLSTNRTSVRWNFSESNPNPCQEQWQGLYCQCSARICSLIAIDLPHMNLTGTIPEDISSFSSLLVLKLSTNSIRSSLPSGLASLTKLVELSIDLNYLEGSVPNATFAQLENLRVLDISDNLFTGSFPDAFLQYKNITFLAMARNGFTGAFPKQLCSSLPQLRLLEMGTNNFTQTLPPEIGNCSALTRLSLLNNSFSGTIPNTLSRLRWLKMLDLSLNLLTGSLPPELSELPRLSALIVYQNLLEYTIPVAYENLSSLELFSVAGNLLTGTLPAWLSTAPRLSAVIVDGNAFHGDIPFNPNISVWTCSLNWLSGNLSFSSAKFLTLMDISFNAITSSLPDVKMPHLLILDVQANFLEGSIPHKLNYSSFLDILAVMNNSMSGTIPEFIIQFPNATEVLVGFNAFTGTLPEVKRPNNALYQFVVSRNYLRGTIPRSFANLTMLTQLQMATNMLTGSLPDSLVLLRNLSIVMLTNNSLSGPLVGKFDGSSQRKLTSLDFSHNQFTGDLPRQLFLASKLVDFAASGNCLSGTLPSDICHATSLQTLELNGVSTADTCRERIFRFIPSFTAFTLSRSLSGSIPPCIFALPELESLHLSGNALEGDLPNDLNISNSLINLALSYNQLTGKLPARLKKNKFYSLDLSYNRFRDELDSDFSPVYGDGASLYLQVNRLSGSLPASLYNISSLSVLDGNIFQCGFFDRNLPANDPHVDDYNCGSNNLDGSMAIWAIIVAIILLAMACIALYFNNQSLQPLVLLRYWFKTFREVNEALRSPLSPNLQLMMNFFEGVRRLFSIVTAFISFVIFPLCSGLSLKYSSYIHIYTWQISAVWLSGFDAALSIALAFAVLFIIAVWFIEIKIRPWARHIKPEAAGVVKRTDSKLMSYGRLACIAFVNLSIMIVVDAVYVYIFLNYNASIVALTQWLTALFKVIWNESVVWQAIPALKHLTQRLLDTHFREHDIVRYTRTELRFVVSIILLNNLIIPALAIAIISSNCFYNAIFAADSVTDTYAINECVLYAGDIIRIRRRNQVQCVQEVPQPLTTSYDPPFIYSYSCASTLYVNYSSVYIYMFILVGAVVPLAKLYVSYVFRVFDSGHWLHRLLDSFLMEKFKPTASQRADSLMTVRMMHSERIITRIISYLAIVLSFGAVFPPLAVFGMIALYANTYAEQLLAGSLVVEGDQLQMPLFRTKLDAEVRDITELFLSSVWLAFPFVVIMQAYLVFDTEGDEHGTTAALIMTGVLLSCMALAWIFSRELIREWFQQSILRFFSLLQQQKVQTTSSNVEMMKVLATSPPSLSLENDRARGSSTSNITSQSSIESKDDNQIMASEVVENPVHRNTLNPAEVNLVEENEV
eukprot:scaffold2062_cov181-Ochromonas_danica.AAC.10